MRDSMFSESDLRRVVDENLLNPVSGAVGVWDLRAGVLCQKRVAQSQLQLLSSLIATSGLCVLWYSENPLKDALIGSWSIVGKDTYVIPRDCDVRELLNWLCLGNWLIGVTAYARDTEPALLNASVDVSSLRRRMLAQKVSAVVSASHDSGIWRIAVTELAAIPDSP